MRIEASAGRHKKGKPGLHDHCERLTLKADDDQDASALSFLYRAIVHGKWSEFARSLPDEVRKEMGVTE